MIAFIDDQRAAYGVEPICWVLADRPVHKCEVAVSQKSSISR